MILKVDGISLSYGQVRVLSNVNLEIPDDKIVGLIGANSAGKTTTLRAISGLSKAQEGHILFQGKEITNLTPPAILAEGIAHVPQEGRPFSQMTVYENLMMGAFLFKKTAEIKSDLNTVYDYFPILSERSNQKAGTLSGGERQMLAVGRALMSRPKLLVMDEPTAGLAPMIVEKVGEIITRLNKDGISILLVEQNADMALNVSDYCYVMEKGTIALEGESKKLLSDDTVRQAYLGI